MAGTGRHELEGAAVVGRGLEEGVDLRGVGEVGGVVEGWDGRCGGRRFTEVLGGVGGAWSVGGVPEVRRLPGTGKERLQRDGRRLDAALADAGLRRGGVQGGLERGGGFGHGRHGGQAQAGFEIGEVGDEHGRGEGAETGPAEPLDGLGIEGSEQAVETLNLADTKANRDGLSLICDGGTTHVLNLSCGVVMVRNTLSLRVRHPAVNAVNELYYEIIPPTIR